MRIIFSNQFGCHSKSNIVLNFPRLVDVDVSEHDLALSQGWLKTIDHSSEHWYQSRSTRIKLSLTNYDLIDCAGILDQPDYCLLDEIYTKYCSHKHYKKYFEVGGFDGKDIIIGYYLQRDLTAWTKLRPYSAGSIESVLFVWDYRDPESHLGLKSLRHEAAWAKLQNYQYFYTGPGYEKNSIYKSDLDGFEWWTGEQWSQDRDQYIWLCKRDSQIASNHQIHAAFSNLQQNRNSS